MGFPFVSVIVPVFEDRGKLAICLDALRQQTYPRASYEVLVVDNHLNQKFPGLHEPGPGSYRARNLGIRHARGEIFAFIDADCEPDRDWIEKGVQALGNCDILGGEVIQTERQYPNLFEIYCMVFLPFTQSRFIREQKFSGAGNLFAWKRVFNDVGPFSPEMKSAGDVEWGQRASAKGYQITFCDHVIVRHSARQSFLEILKKERRLVGGSFQLRSRGLRIFPGAILSIAASPLTPCRPSIWKKIGNQKGIIKIKLVLLSTFFRYVRAFEWIRLLIGGVPVR